MCVFVFVFVFVFFVFQDLKEAQPSLGRGLQQLLDFEGDVEGTFDRTFQISHEVIIRETFYRF